MLQINIQMDIIETMNIRSGEKDLNKQKQIIFKINKILGIYKNNIIPKNKHKFFREILTKLFYNTILSKDKFKIKYNIWIL